MQSEGRGRRRSVALLTAGAGAAAAPVLLLSAVALGVLGVLGGRPPEAAGGILVALVATLVEHRRAGAAQDRLVRMRTRLRLVRSRADEELAEARRQLRELDHELWEYRLVDQMTPQARTLISGMAATLARPYVPAPEGEEQDADWDLFDTHPIDLAGVRGGSGPVTEPEQPAEAVTEPERPAEPGPRRAPSPHHPERPTVELPVIRPGGAVVDLRARAVPVPEPATDVAELDELVYRQIVGTAQDELAAVLQPAARRAAVSAAGPQQAGVPDDPGRRTA